MKKTSYPNSTRIFLIAIIFFMAASAPVLSFDIEYVRTFYPGQILFPEIDGDSEYRIFFSPDSKLLYLKGHGLRAIELETGHLKDIHPGDGQTFLETHNGLYTNLIKPYPHDAHDTVVIRKLNDNYLRKVEIDDPDANWFIGIDKVYLTNDGKKLITHGTYILIFDVESNELLKSIRLNHKIDNYSSDIFPGNNIFAYYVHSLGDGTTIGFIDLETMTLTLDTIQGIPYNSIDFMRFSPGGKYLMFNTLGELSFYNLQKGEIEWRIDNCVMSIKDIGIAKGDRYFAYPVEKRQFYPQSEVIRVVDLQEGREVKRIPINLITKPKIVRMTPDNKQIVVVGHDGLIELYDMETGNFVRTLAYPGVCYSYSRVSDDGMLSVTFMRHEYSYHNLLFINPQTGNLERYLDADANGYDMIQTEDDYIVAFLDAYTSGNGKDYDTLKIYSYKRDEYLNKIPVARPYEYSKLRLNQNISRILQCYESDDWDGHIRVFDIESGEIIADTTSRYGNPIRSAYFIDNSRIGFLSKDKYHVWNYIDDKFEVLKECTGNQNGRLSFDGKYYILNGHPPHTINPLTGETIKEMYFYLTPYSDLFFNSDKTQLFGLHLNKMMIWNYAGSGDTLKSFTFPEWEYMKDGLYYGKYPENIDGLYVSANLEAVMSNLYQYDFLIKWGDPNAVGIADPRNIKESEIIYAYPNPCRGILNIHLNSKNISAPVKITLHNRFGVNVAEIFSGMPAPGMEKINYNTSSLPQGAYILKYLNGKSHFIKKIIIAR